MIQSFIFETFKKLKNFAPKLSISLLCISFFNDIKTTVFFEFINSSSTFQKLWIHILNQLVLQCIDREKDLLTSSPESRYQRVLKRSPQLFQMVPHKYIASYLRMSPETLSRLKKS